MNAFELDRVTFRYDGTAALDAITLAIPSGRRVALVGANGSGKSTLLRLLAALAHPDEGEVRFDGSPVTEESMLDETRAFAFRRRVGIVFQSSDAQLFNPTVFDELAFGPLQLRWPREQIVARVEATLEQFGIAHLRDRSPHRLSGGEKKRVALASVLILDPDVLLLDEPTAALDPRGQAVIVDLLQQCADGRRTVILATHDLGIVEDLADLCVVMAAGHVAYFGPVQDVLHDEELLRRTGLLHAHRHAHEDGVVHSHPHRHHDHTHR